MAICIGAAAQNGGQDYNALVEQNQAAVESAAQNLKDQSQRNNRQIDILEKENALRQKDVDRLKEDLKALKESKNNADSSVKLQQEVVKHLKTTGASKQEPHGHCLAQGHYPPHARCLMADFRYGRLQTPS